jgi:glycosyltransferase involved in cell wall biosynthesis
VGDVEAQAARVIELLKDEALYTRMSRAARHKTEEQFDTTKVISQYEAYYQEVLAAQ